MIVYITFSKYGSREGNTRFGSAHLEGRTVRLFYMSALAKEFAAVDTESLNFLKNELPVWAHVTLSDVIRIKIKRCVRNMVRWRDGT